MTAVNANYCAIYDFELFPYALGDVLTWNVRSSVYAEEAGCSGVDLYICVDPRYPSCIYQRELVQAENSPLYFNELFGAFGTHPMLGNIFVFGSRDDMLARLREVAGDHPANVGVLAGYEDVLSRRDDRAALDKYFIEYVFSHSHLNAFAARHGRIPLLVASRGCTPDVQGLIANVLGDKRIVIVHPRLRRLDYGLAGAETYSRDSDFLEWYAFLRAAAERHQEVQFVVVGRLQEKPIELLRLPNVTSLRTIGLGLGHELTLMLHADFFIGTSSGFAAMANFSKLPYFITHMNKESCNAYAIPQGSARLPFAAANQLLIYEPETSAMLMRLLEQGLAIPPREQPALLPRNAQVSPWEFLEGQAKRLSPAATTSRFFLDDAHADQETAFLIWPKLQQAIAASTADPIAPRLIAQRAAHHFPRLPLKFRELKHLMDGTVSTLTPPPIKHRIRMRIANLNSKVLPRSLRGRLVHRIARRVKRRLLARGAYEQSRLH